MKVSVRKISGPGYEGYVLDKHTSKSTYLGDNEYGHPKFETIRTDVGEATYRLKYRGDWSKAEPLAQAIATHIYPKLKDIGLIVPMPASTTRARQPVTEVARALGHLVKTPVFEKLLLKSKGHSLKDLISKDEKDAANEGRFSVRDEIYGDGTWNLLLIDDLFHTGSSAEAAAAALSTYEKISRVYLAALTWRPS